jgi:hypothetical protein
VVGRRDAENEGCFLTCQRANVAIVWYSLLKR